MTSKIPNTKYSFRKNKKLFIKNANPTDTNATKTIKIILTGLIDFILIPFRANTPDNKYRKF